MRLSVLLFPMPYPGAAENFPDWDTPAHEYPGYPFGGSSDKRDRTLIRKMTGEEAFANYDKACTEPRARKYVAPPEIRKPEIVVPQLNMRSCPQLSRAFPSDVTDEEN